MGETFINVFFNGKERILKAFVMRNAQNLFGMDWMEEFDLFNVQINTFCNKLDGTIICADYSTKLNDCLKEINYPLPTVEEIFANLNGGCLFSKLDLSEAYLQIPVEEKCAELLTINTRRGLYKMNRLQYGIKVAPTIFQKIMYTMLADLDFATTYLDDILIKNSDKLKTSQ